MNYKKYIQEKLGVREAYKFAKWSFGEGFETKTMNEIWKDWNQLHGHMLILLSNGRPNDDFDKMIDLYKKELIEWKQ
jgi:hypothetical protein